MPERTVEVVPEEGLHARPASLFVEMVNDHDATVMIGPEGAADDDLVNASSMLAVTGLGVAGGEKLRIVADGADAEDVLDALEELLSTPEDEL